ncbi:hypothetical protein AMJ87_11150, partial [candidate division WOR_3 bacterium SM23_60]
MKTKKQKLFAAVVVLLVIGFAFANVITNKRVVPVKDTNRSGYRAVEGYGLPEGVEVLKPTTQEPARPRPLLDERLEEPRLHPQPLEHGAEYYLPVRQWEREQVARYKQWLIDEGWVNPDGSQKYNPGRVIVQFKNEMRSMVQPDFSEATPAFGISSVDAINAAYNAQTLERVIEPEAIKLGSEALVMKHGLDLIYTITFDEDADVEEIANAYLSDPSIDEASPDWMSYPTNIPQHAEPNDPYWDSTSWSYQDMKILEAWNLETGSSGVEVAHICLGASASIGAHPDIGHLDLDLNYAGSFGGNNGSATTHATACVAMMSAENNNGIG